jgi:hypothetical protein
MSASTRKGQSVVNTEKFPLAPPSSSLSMREAVEGKQGKHMLKSSDGKDIQSLFVSTSNAAGSVVTNEGNGDSFESIPLPDPAYLRMKRMMRQKGALVVGDFSSVSKRIGHETDHVQPTHDKNKDKDKERIYLPGDSLISGSGPVVNDKNMPDIDSISSNIYRARTAAAAVGFTSREQLSQQSRRITGAMSSSINDQVNADGQSNSGPHIRNSAWIANNDSQADKPNVRYHSHHLNSYSDSDNVAYLDRQIQKVKDAVLQTQVQYSLRSQDSLGMKTSGSGSSSGSSIEDIFSQSKHYTNNNLQGIHHSNSSHTAVMNAGSAFSGLDSQLSHPMHMNNSLINKNYNDVPQLLPSQYMQYAQYSQPIQYHQRTPQQTPHYTQYPQDLHSNSQSHMRPYSRTSVRAWSPSSPRLLNSANMASVSSIRNDGKINENSGSDSRT